MMKMNVCSKAKWKTNLDGIDVVNNTWSFSREFMASNRAHTIGSAVTAIAYTFGYDHVGRTIFT